MSEAANLIANENAAQAPGRAPSGSRSWFCMLDARLNIFGLF
jgi:hypothetical protein